MEDELVQLDSIYRSPGFLLLAVDDQGERLGCVGARSLDDDNVGSCEIRRLFVRPAGRGAGLGRQLTERVIAQASTAGFDRLVLNTLPAMTEAIALYDAMGFVRIEPYVEEPLDEVLYFARKL